MVAEPAALVDDVDAEDDGRSALWVAVQADKPDNARVWLRLARTRGGR